MRVSARTFCHTSLHDALGETPRPLQIAWADDLSLLVDFDSPQEAVALLPRLATLILCTIEAFRFKGQSGTGENRKLLSSSVAMELRLLGRACLLIQLAYLLRTGDMSALSPSTSTLGSRSAPMTPAAGTLKRLRVVGVLFGAKLQT